MKIPTESFCLQINPRAPFDGHHVKRAPRVSVPCAAGAASSEPAREPLSLRSGLAAHPAQPPVHVVRRAPAKRERNRSFECGRPRALPLPLRRRAAFSLAAPAAPVRRQRRTEQLAAPSADSQPPQLPTPSVVGRTCTDYNSDGEKSFVSILACLIL